MCTLLTAVQLPMYPPTHAPPFASAPASAHSAASASAAAMYAFQQSQRMPQPQLSDTANTVVDVDGALETVDV